MTAKRRREGRREGYSWSRKGKSLGVRLGRRREGLLGWVAGGFVGCVGEGGWGRETTKEIGRAHV